MRNLVQLFKLVLVFTTIGFWFALYSYSLYESNNSYNSVNLVHSLVSSNSSSYRYKVYSRKSLNEKLHSGLFNDVNTLSHLLKERWDSYFQINNFVETFNSKEKLDDSSVLYKRLIDLKKSSLYNIKYISLKNKLRLTIFNNQLLYESSIYTLNKTKRDNKNFNISLSIYELNLDKVINVFESKLVDPRIENWKVIVSDSFFGKILKFYVFNEEGRFLIVQYRVKIKNDTNNNINDTYYLRIYDFKSSLSKKFKDYELTIRKPFTSLLVKSQLIIYSLHDDEYKFRTFKMPSNITTDSKLENGPNIKINATSWESYTQHLVPQYGNEICVVGVHNYLDRYVIYLERFQILNREFKSISFDPILIVNNHDNRIVDWQIMTWNGNEMNDGNLFLYKDNILLTLNNKLIKNLKFTKHSIIKKSINNHNIIALLSNNRKVIILELYSSIIEEYIPKMKKKEKYSWRVKNIFDLPDIFDKFEIIDIKVISKKTFSDFITIKSDYLIILFKQGYIATFDISNDKDIDLFLIDSSYFEYILVISIVTSYLLYHSWCRNLRIRFYRLPYNLLSENTNDNRLRRRRRRIIQENLNTEPLVTPSNERRNQNYNSIEYENNKKIKKNNIILKKNKKDKEMNGNQCMMTLDNKEKELRKKIHRELKTWFNDLNKNEKHNNNYKNK